MRTEARLLLGIGVAVLAGGIVYWATSDEGAGTTMLLLAGVLALMIGGFLHLEGRRLPDPEPAGPVASLEDAYLPHQSVWPFVVGTGAVLVGNGLILGLWAVVPGAIVLLFGVVGFARQSRRRD